MKRSNNLFKKEEQPSGKVSWKKFLDKALVENKFSMKVEEYDINPTIQAIFANTKLTTKPMDDEDKLTVFIILKNI